MRKAGSVLVALGVVLALGGCSSIPGLGGLDGSGGATEGGGAGQPAAPEASGIQDQTPEEIFASAEAAYNAATSVRITGELTQAGSTMTLDLQLARAGDAVVSVTQDQGTVEMIRLGGQSWVRVEGGGLIPPEAAAVIGGRWILVTPDSATAAGLAQTADGFASMDGFGTSFFANMTSLEKVEGETVNGVPTVGLRDAEGGIVHIAAQGEPYPLLVTGPEGQDPTGRIEFSAYNEQLAVTPPPDAIEDVESLIGGYLGG